MLTVAGPNVYYRHGCAAVSCLGCRHLTDETIREPDKCSAAGRRPVPRPWRAPEWCPQLDAALAEFAAVEAAKGEGI